MRDKIYECPFCNIDKTKLVNTILDETNYFYITPSLGSLIEGYILITTKRHVNSMSELTIDEMEEYKILIKKYREVFKKIYQKYPIVFEHGTPNLNDNINASSVIHAHTHVVNHNYKNENILIEKLKFKRIDKLENMLSNKNYIFYISPKNEIYITNEFEPISQFMRIEIAKDLNLVDKYDWRKNDFNDNIILTINKLNDYFDNKTNKGSDFMNENKTNINWYPGHMAKTKRLISENINLIDIVYEVIDARIPYSSKIKDIDNLLRDKPRILVVTKMDLCDTDETNKFLEEYRKQGYTVIAVDLVNGKNVNEIINKTKEVLKPLDEKRIAKGLKKRSYRALIVGIPNVGKSTLINRLVGKKATQVGNKPGVTKNLSWVRINSDIDLLDSPGILWPRLDEEEVALNLASMSAIKEEILSLSDISVHILNKLNDHYSDKLKERYGIENVNKDDYLETFDIIGRKRGCLLRGNVVDYDKVYSLIVRDIKDSNIKGITFDRF